MDRLALPFEYVADEIDVAVPGSREIADVARAADLVVDFLGRRLTAVTAGRRRPGLMLSAGIDSILVAAVCRSLGLDPLAVTVVAASRREEADAAAKVAADLGIEHRVVELRDDELLDQTSICIDLIGTDEVWEVLAAVVLRAAFGEFARAAVAGPVLTGMGADALLAGGEALEAPVESVQAASALDAWVQAEVAENFRRGRLVPDFYERVLGADHGRFVMPFQSVAAWRLAQRFSPAVLWGDRDGVVHDKFALRRAAEDLGVAPELVWTRKSPMQHSSGLVAILAGQLREAMASRPGAGTYTDPRSEDVEVLAARVALRFLPQVRQDLQQA